MHPLREIHTANKRAHHFVGKANLKVEGKFEPIGKTGLSIPVRNWLWLLNIDASHCTPEEHAETDLAFTVLCARWINKYIDGHLIESDVEACVALQAYLANTDWDHLDPLMSEIP